MVFQDDHIQCMGEIRHQEVRHRRIQLMIFQGHRLDSTRCYDLDKFCLCNQGGNAGRKFHPLPICLLQAIMNQTFPYPVFSSYFYP